jgi:hypothetical protein
MHLDMIFAVSGNETAHCDRIEVRYSSIKR